jgi:lipoate-protein ligase A
MRTQSVYKIPQGKLLKISVEFDEKNFVIQDIRITGDFFIYPEEAVEVIESNLRNTVMEQRQLQEKISSIISRYHIEFIGLNVEGLTKGILMCRP